MSIGYGFLDLNSFGKPPKLLWAYPFRRTCRLRTATELACKPAAYIKEAAASTDAPDVALTNETELKGMEIIMSEFS